LDHRVAVDRERRWSLIRGRGGFACLILPRLAIYPDGAGAICTTAALWALVRLELGAGLGTRHLVGIGATLALLPWLHTRFAVVTGVMGMALALRLLPRANRGHAMVALMAVPAASALAWLAYFWAIWGTPNPSAPYGPDAQTSVANLVKGVPGLLVDQQFGLLPNAPIYALVVVGMATLARRHWRLAAELTVLAVVYVAPSPYAMWCGYSAPARFLVVILPVCALPLALLRPRRARPACHRTGPAGCQRRHHPREGGRDQGQLLYNARDGFDLMLDWANRSVNLPLAWPSLHRIPSAMPSAMRRRGATGAHWCRRSLMARRRPALAWVIASAWFAVTVMGAASFVWSRHANSLTVDTSGLDLLHRWPSGGMARDGARALRHVAGGTGALAHRPRQRRSRSTSGWNALAVRGASHPGRRLRDCCRRRRPPRRQAHVVHRSHDASGGRDRSGGA
jgi:hypothetical protein